MKYNFGDVIFPQNFKYIEVIRKGKPLHEKNDNFYLRHPPMELSKRAKIFAPFDALKGFNDAVASKEILYEERKELNDEDKRELDIKVNILYNLTLNSKIAKKNNIKAEITYFKPCNDINNEAYMLKGKYETVKGIIQKVDTVIHKTIRIDNIEIAISDIIKIEYHNTDSNIDNINSQIHFSS